MKILAVFMIALSGLLAGCIVADTPYYGDNRGEVRRDRDRDGDGVPNRQDRRPDDARRY